MDVISRCEHGSESWLNSIDLLVEALFYSYIMTCLDKGDIKLESETHAEMFKKVTSYDAFEARIRTANVMNWVRRCRNAYKKQDLDLIFNKSDIDLARCFLEHMRNARIDINGIPSAFDPNLKLKVEFLKISFNK